MRLTKQEKALIVYALDHLTLAADDIDLNDLKFLGVIKFKCKQDYSDQIEFNYQLNDRIQQLKAKLNA